MNIGTPLGYRYGMTEYVRRAEAESVARAVEAGQIEYVSREAMLRAVAFYTLKANSAQGFDAMADAHNVQAMIRRALSRRTNGR